MKNFNFYLNITSVYFPDFAHSLAEDACYDMFGDPGPTWNIERHPDNFTLLGFASEDDVMEFEAYWQRLLPPPIHLGSMGSKYV
jgi:hypothetical protein